MSADQPSLLPPWVEDDPYDMPYQARGRGLERLTHLVLVDGRLVDMWSEPVSGTRWQEHAERFDRERRPAVVSPPAPPLHVQVLSWLDAAVGGRDQLLALHAGPLVDEGFEPAPELRPDHRERLATTVDLLDRAAGELRVADSRPLLMNTLRSAWDADAETVLEMGDAGRVAAGVCWLAAKANGLLGPGGTTTQTSLQHVLGCRTQLAVPGREIRLLLAGYRPEPVRPTPTLPDLVLVGRADLLTAATRRRLVRARDQALAAQSATDDEPDVRAG
ncbi:MAG TPA: hypothetical protein VGK78_02290 [Nocardioides sp.]|uniref:hypothetical protein n=1 Tax=Nocardioides sp. TaxID=35761 RepID=UPI002F3F90E4